MSFNSVFNNEDHILSPLFTDMTTDGRPRPNESTIFVGQLESFADEETLDFLFTGYGRVLSSKVVRDANGVSRGYGFVKFAKQESADRAVREHNGQTFYSRQLVVKHKTTREERDTDRPEGQLVNPLTDTKLYVTNLNNEYNTEDKLRALFSRFGDVTSARVVDDKKRSKCYGFLSFADSSVADNAIRILNGMLLKDGKRLIVRRAHNREDLAKVKSGDWKITRVFVTNLDKDIDERSLNETMSTFGKVMSCRINVDDLGYSRGMASVVFFNESDANQAITGANGMLLNGKKIVVKLAERGPKTDKKDDNDPKRIFVNNLPKDIDTEDKLRAMFGWIGIVTEVWLPKDANGQTKGHGTVTYDDQTMAEMMCNIYNGLPIEGKKLTVKKHQSKTERLAQAKNRNLVGCQICYDPIKKSQAVTYGCEHQFCAHCVRKYLETQIEGGQIDELNCPDPDCNREANQQLIKKSVSKAMYERLEILTLKKAAQDMQDVIYCPTPNCGGLISSELALLRAHCHKCQLTYCPSCMKKYHGLTNCPLNEEQKRQQEQLSENFVKEKARKCPKCKSPIEKNGGCDHMTCKCGHQFCWLCNNSWAVEHLCINTTVMPNY